MLATALAVIAFQQGSISVSAGSGQKTAVRIHVTESDSTRQRDSTSRSNKPISATPAQIASAFADPQARTLLERARVARMQQDSSLTAYEASTLQRLTIGLGLTKFGRDRILFRSEGAARVRWSRNVGAQIDVTGRRSAAPAIGGSSDVDIEGALSPIPYFPGRDALWLGLDVVKDTEDKDDVINPMSRYAEAFYTYKTGDSVTFRLPGGSVVQLRELEVRPRRPDWHAVVGSFWFDVSSGQLVRAAFRMSQPIDFLNDETSDDDKPGPVARAFIPKTTGSIDGVAVEYGLYQGRFWLPRTEIIQGNITAGFARMPMSIEEHFTYSSVNALDTLPTMRDRRASVSPPPPPPGTDKATAARLRRQFTDSVNAAREKTECDATGSRSIRTDRYDAGLALMVYIPCDTAKLAHSPDLPGSLFDANDAVFGDAERDALLARAKTMMPPMPAFQLMRPSIQYGPDLQRYNRVEGLSLSFDATMPVAPATSLRFSPRMGTADRVFNGELSLARLNGAGTNALTVYKRLDAVNDWGNPLSFGSGLSAFLFGRDEGFYYRTTGAELAGDKFFGRAVQWRLFMERQRSAPVNTNVSLPHAFGSSGFSPLQNIIAGRAHESGASIRKVSTFGLDPEGFRLLSDLRLEGAFGDFDYGRGALDLTLSHPLGRAFNRDFSAALTAGAGTTAGQVPLQRLYYVGGISSIRGEDAGSRIGTSYWLTRTEIGYGGAGFRRLLFLDLGWAGDRRNWGADVKPASGVGLGWSFLDGLIRTDVARGLQPKGQWAFGMYLNGKY